MDARDGGSEGRSLLARLPEHPRRLPGLCGEAALRGACGWLMYGKPGQRPPLGRGMQRIGIGRVKGRSGLVAQPAQAPQPCLGRLLHRVQQAAHLAGTPGRQRAQRLAERMAQPRGCRVVWVGEVDDGVQLKIALIAYRYCARRF